MLINAHKSHKVVVGESIKSILDKYLPRLKEKTIVVITSKIISLCENSVASKDVSKEQLIKDEADYYLEENLHDICLTIKNNILIPSAGIDGSNCGDLYVLYPKDIQKSAKEIWGFLRNRDGVKELGVLITDSHTTPLRWGVIGIGIGWYGFNPLYNYVGTPDCFGRLLQHTQRNNVDALAAAAVFVMGEGAEQTPLATIENAPNIEFGDFDVSISIPMEVDLYGPVLKAVKWRSRCDSNA